MAGRDIGPIRHIENVERRMACERSLLEFARAYHPEAIYLELADFHHKAISKIEDAIFAGSLFCLSLPRGSGKTTWVRIGLHWAISYGHRIYPFVIGANADKAHENLDAIKVALRFNEEWCRDFPDISQAIIDLEGQPLRTKSQHCLGIPTTITWAKDRVVLPTNPLPANHPSFDKEDPTKPCPSSGIVIGVSGLTGDGIRGSLFARNDGTNIRPDFCFLDDPQSDESASSPSQCRTRIKLVSGAVLGMAGPDRTISAVMPCTVIAPGDLADEMLDRTKHPLWRGERVPMMASMPKNMGAWEAYFETFSRCINKEPPDTTEANEEYVANRDVLDAGAEPTWEARKLDSEVSAIQHAMHLFYRDREAFFSEYQNAPLSNDDRSNYLTAIQISQKVHELPRKTPPSNVEKVTCFVDVQQDSLWYVIIGFSQNRFDGYVLDYSTFPEQRSRYFDLSSMATRLSTIYPGYGLEAAMLRGLNELLEDLQSREYVRADGVTLHIDQIGVDSGYQTRLLEKWLIDGRKTGVVLTRGVGVKATETPWSDYRPKAGDLIGHYWRQLVPKDKRDIRKLEVDTNYWKSFVHTRFATALGDPGSLSLYNENPLHHKLFAEHMKAEFSQDVEANGRKVEQWRIKPSQPDNHWFDGVVGCHCLASFTGVTMGSAMRNARSRGRRSAARLPR